MSSNYFAGTEVGINKTNHRRVDGWVSIFIHTSGISPVTGMAGLKALLT